MSSNITSFQHKNPAGSGKRVIERLKGTGLVTTRRGRESSARYHLSVTQDEAECGPGDHAPHGPNTYAGQIWCPHDGSFVAVHQGQTMTLRMEDGRQLNFIHSDRDGGVTVTNWIG